MTDSNRQNEKIILDQSGTPLPQRVTWRDRWKALSSKAKIVLVSVLAIITTSSTLVKNVDTIKPYFQARLTPIEVPLLTVKVLNNTQKDIQVTPRGDLFLWLPGPGARHMVGKYKFIEEINKESAEAEKYRVKSGLEEIFIAQILNQDSYRELLKKEELDLSLSVRPITGGLKFTDNIPFTQDAINKYYFSVAFD